MGNNNNLIQSEKEQELNKTGKLNKDYITIGKTRVSVWRAWLAIGIAAGFLMGIVFVSYTSWPQSSIFTSTIFHKESTAGPAWKSQDEMIKGRKIKAASEILEINLSFDAETMPPFKFKEVQKRMGYAPKNELVNKGYTLQLLDRHLNVLDSLFFAIPNIIYGPPPQEGDKKINQALILKKVDLALTIPWKENAAFVQILSPEQEVIASASVLGLPTVQGKQNFRSIPGNEFLKGKLLNFIHQIIPIAYAATGDTLDITFIGDDYLTAADLDIFHNDVNRFISHMLTYEPFRSRASQILFHYVDNTADLGCHHDATITRLIVCNNSTVTTAVNKSGVPYDKIVVIVNDSVYGGSGGSIAVSYNGSSGPQVVAHEFGHSLGGLIDEYNLYSGGTLDNNIHTNCYGGNPPASGWASLVAVADYALGCNYPTWYRSFPGSIMLSLSHPYFNAVSQVFLNRKLDFFSSPFSDSVSPTSAIVSPANGATVSGTVSVSATASDNNGIARAELWKDGALFHSDFQSPYTFSWPTTSDTNSVHTLETRAYDVVGNTGSSGIISITVNNTTSDITPPTASISSPAEGSTASGLTTVNVTASDNSGTVSKVDLYRSGIFLASDNSAPFSFSWDTTKETNGSHTLQAKAYDPSSNIGSSAIITVTVNNNTLDTESPIVLITSPTNGSTVARRATITFSAAASDNVGVTRVEFYINGSLACTDTTADIDGLTYACSWKVPSASKKTYQIQARAYDAAGKIGTSQISVKSK